MDNSIHGNQNQVFSVFLLLTIHSNCAQLVTARFNGNRALSEAWERAAKIYSWQVFLGSSILTKVLSQTVETVLEFVYWFYPVGMFRNANSTAQMNQRSTLMFLFLLVYSYFTPTFSIALAAGLEQAGVAVNIGQLFYFLLLIFCG